MTNANEDLGKRIEQLIAEHVAAARKVPAPIAARPVRVRESGKRRGAADLSGVG